MAQLEIAYLIITFSLGLLSLALVAFFHFSLHAKDLKPFLAMYGVFTVMNVTNFTTSYMRANIADYEQPAYYLLLYLENPVLLTAMLFLLPYFIHSLVRLPDASRRNRLFAGIAVITFVVYAGSVFISLRFPFGHVGSLIKNGMLGLVLVYSWYTLLRRAPATRKLSAARVRRTVQLSLIFIPLIVHDMFLLRYTGIKFFPLVYALTGLLLARYFYLEHFRSPPIPDLPERGASPDLPVATLEAMGISSREMDVLALLVEGKSYREIGEELHISLNTVKAHIRSIYPKLDVSSRHEIMHKLRLLEHSSES